MFQEHSKNAIDLVKRLLHSPTHELTRWQRSVVYGIELARHGAAELRHDKASQVAAALTYHTLFSLLPTIVLAMVVLQSFVGVEDRNHFKNEVVSFLLPEAADVDYFDFSNSAETERAQELMKGRQELADRVQGLMNSISNISFTGLGVVGLILFIYGATGLLSTIEKSFNAIFGIVAGRAWYLRLPFHYTIITITPVLLIAAQALQTRLFAMQATGTWMKWMLGPAGVIAPFMLVWAAVLALYILLPNTYVPRRAAAIGSFVAAVLWVTLKDLFRYYVAHAAVTNIYGALGLLPLFLLWLYITWLIVLFGLELTHVVAGMKNRQFKHLAGRQIDDQVIDPGWMVPLATQIAICFEQGRSCRLDELGQMLNLAPRGVSKMLIALEKAELVHRVATTGGDSYSLTRPASRITVQRVLDVAGTLMPSRDGAAAQTPSAPAWRLLTELRSSSRRLAETTTLADLTVDGAQTPPAASSASAPATA
jgi:membrane protein